MEVHYKQPVSAETMTETLAETRLQHSQLSEQIEPSYETVDELVHPVSSMNPSSLDVSYVFWYVGGGYSDSFTHLDHG